MEAELLSDNLEWEARRVAAAFGVKGQIETRMSGPFMNMSARFGPANSFLEWKFLRPMGNILVAELFLVKVAPISDDEVDDWSDMKNCVSYSAITYSRSRDAWNIETYGKRRGEMNGLLTAGLFCLGFKESLLDKIGYPLTAHEKLELRLSMPREFWPKKWIDEKRITPAP